MDENICMVAFHDYIGPIQSNHDDRKKSVDTFDETTTIIMNSMSCQFLSLTLIES